MDYSVEELLAKLNQAYKNVTEYTTFGQAVLQPEKQTRFVQVMQDNTVVLPQARYAQMNAHIYDIDIISLTDILKAGTTGTWKPREYAETHRALAEAEWAIPDIGTNSLVAKELVAIVSIRDSALRRNIEKENFEDTLIDLMGKAAGRDLERFAFFANPTIADKTLALSKTEGWIMKAPLKIYHDEYEWEDDGDAPNPELMFDSMLNAMNVNYLANLTDFRFWIDWKTRDDYLNIVKKRGTLLGDSIYEGKLPPYKGIQVEWVPTLSRYLPLKDRSEVPIVGATGRVAILGMPQNHVWGVFHQIAIEREREAKDRRTDFVLTIEADAGFEDENACVVAFIEKESGS